MLIVIVMIIINNIRNIAGICRVSKPSPDREHNKYDNYTILLRTLFSCAPPARLQIFTRDRKRIAAETTREHTADDIYYAPFNIIIIFHTRRSIRYYYQWAHREHRLFVFGVVRLNYHTANSEVYARIKPLGVFTAENVKINKLKILNWNFLKFCFWNRSNISGLMTAKATACDVFRKSGHTTLGATRVRVLFKETTNRFE